MRRGGGGGGSRSDRSGAWHEPRRSPSAGCAGPCGRGAAPTRSTNPILRSTRSCMGRIETELMEAARGELEDRGAMNSWDLRCPGRYPHGWVRPRCATARSWKHVDHGWRPDRANPFATGLIGIRINTSKGHLNTVRIANASSPKRLQTHRQVSLESTRRNPEKERDLCVIF